MVNWYNHTPFDVIGDLTYGESFHSLEKGGYHPWVRSIFAGIKISSQMFALSDLPPVYRIVKLLTPSSLKEKGNANFNYSVKNYNNVLIEAPTTIQISCRMFSSITMREV